MFKKELSLILAFCMIFTAVVFGNAVRSSADAAVVNIDFSAQGFENAQELTTLSVGGVDVTFDKGEGSSAPSYYDTGTGARLYGGNSMTVSSSVAITQIKFTFTQENGTLSASVGTPRASATACSPRRNLGRRFTSASVMKAPSMIAVNAARW